MSHHKLSPLTMTPAGSKIVILLVGSVGTKKKELVKALKDMLFMDVSREIDVKTANSLPIPIERERSFPAINLIIFLIDMTNRFSFDIVKSSLTHCSSSCFMGKACLAVVNLSKRRQHTFPLEHVTELSKIYDCPVFYAPTNERGALLVLSRSLLRIAHRNAKWSHVERLSRDLIDT